MFRYHLCPGRQSGERCFALSGSIQKTLRNLLVLLTPLMLTGCGSDETEKQANRSVAHRPANYVAAVNRLQRLHVQILEQPLVARVIHARHHHHDHHHHDGHSHNHQHVKIDALQEMQDIVGWLPALAADTELEEKPWSRVEKASNGLTVMLTSMNAPDASQRQEAYKSQAKSVTEYLDVFVAVADLPSAGS